VLAPHLQRSDGPLSQQVAVGCWEGLAALGAAARVGEVVPAVHAVAVAAVALVHLALGQREAKVQPRF